MLSPVYSAAGSAPQYLGALYARSSRQPAPQLIGMRDEFVSGTYTSKGQSGIGTFSAVDTTYAYSDGRVVEHFSATQGLTTGANGTPAAAQQLLSSSVANLQFGTLPTLSVPNLTGQIAAFISAHPVQNGTYANYRSNLAAQHSATPSLLPPLYA